MTLDSPRYLTCSCQRQDAATFSPLPGVLAGHTTPELAYAQARFAAVMSYNQAAAMLGEVFPLGRTLYASGVREQVHRIAARLETELGPEEDAGLRGCRRDWDSRRFRIFP